MWQLRTIDNPSGAALWFSDGAPLTAMRGGSGASSRLIVDGLGFLDITDFQNGFPNGPVMDIVDCNGVDLDYTPNPSVQIDLSLSADARFAVTAVGSGQSGAGALKPLPTIDPADAAYLEAMIAQKYVPYQDIPDAPGKSAAEIRALGLQLFPFTPYSFPLAMSIYDWTTASFTRLVLMKIFAYTAMGRSPPPLDQPGIAEAIWESNWNTYNPSNADYMRSFLMVPADSLQNVQTQLAAVADQLQRFADIENRLLAAGFQAMPRTSTVDQAQLFSGQVDIYQLGTEHFGIEFLQCPLNAGPAGVPLQIPLQQALDDYIQVGDTLTTKMVWSFGSTYEEALQYQNGIILIANPPPGAWVWDAASYITPLSDGPDKIEYTFAPGTSFLVQSVEWSQDGKGDPLCLITLQALSD